MEDKNLVVGKHTFKSRVILGTGKYATPEIMVKCHEASGTDSLVSEGCSQTTSTCGGP